MIIIFRLISFINYHWFTLSTTTPIRTFIIHRIPKICCFIFWVNSWIRGIASYLQYSAVSTLTDTCIFLFSLLSVACVPSISINDSRHQGGSTGNNVNEYTRIQRKANRPNHKTKSEIKHKYRKPQPRTKPKSSKFTSITNSWRPKSRSKKWSIKHNKAYLTPHSIFSHLNKSQEGVFIKLWFTIISFA